MTNGLCWFLWNCFASSFPQTYAMLFFCKTSGVLWHYKCPLRRSANRSVLPWSTGWSFTTVQWRPMLSWKSSSKVRVNVDSNEVKLILYFQEKQQMCMLFILFLYVWKQNIPKQTMNLHIILLASTHRSKGIINNEKYHKPKKLILK